MLVLDQLIRLVKRLAVLLPGIVVAYFVAKDIFPAVDRRVPAALAIFISYIIAAYGLIPLVIRLIRLFFIPQHIPLYSTTPDGFASDPINIGLVGTRQDLIKAMTKAGWHQADRRTIKNLFRLGWSMLTDQPYPTAPFSNLYLFGRKQDIGFQLPTQKSPSYRHHVRLWATNLETAKKHQAHVHFWQRLHRPTAPNQTFWVGAASQDIGIRPIRHNFQLTHRIHHNTNAERDLIARDLKRTGQLKSVRTVQAGRPYSIRNRTIGGYFVADGELKVCELKSEKN